MSQQDEDLKRVSDVVEDRNLTEGQHVKVAQLVDKEFVIDQIQEFEGEHGPYLTVAIHSDDWRGFFFTSHKVLFRKLSQCGDSLPLLGKITRRTSDRSGQDYFDIE